MGEILVMMSAPTHPPGVQTVGVEVGKHWTASGEFSSVGNRVVMAVLHLATQVFLAGNHISEEQLDKDYRTEKSMRKEATKFANPK